MGPDPILAQHIEDQKLAVGQQVLARWPDFHGSTSGPALVVSLKPRSVQVQLLRSAGSYPAGYRLELPRISDFEHWSSRHGVRPAPEGVDQARMLR
jgi:hypothetical protein